MGISFVLNQPEHFSSGRLSHDGQTVELHDLELHFQNFRNQPSPTGRQFSHDTNQQRLPMKEETAKSDGTRSFVAPRKKHVCVWDVIEKRRRDNEGHAHQTNHFPAPEN